MEKDIEEVNPYNVVQICTDNASSMKAAANIITNTYLHIYFQRCVVHAMNLLLKGLEEGGINEKGGKEVKDNCEVHKEMIYATCYFIQT